MDAQIFPVRSIFPSSAKMKMEPVPASLPRLGLGMAALGRPGYINLNRDAVFGADGRTEEKMQAQADLVVDGLFRISQSSGATPWIDCARSYGLSERFAGEYLKKRNVKPNDVYVSSKWGYTYVADWKVQLDDGQPHEVKDHSVNVSLSPKLDYSACEIVIAVF
jgi:aryl-alcohol dehydrogenase-like predicted oxidoreductase